MVVETGWWTCMRPVTAISRWCSRDRSVAGSHLLQVTNTGTKNPSATGFWADVDAVEAEALTP